MADHQTMRVAFYPGCVSKGACRELYDSTQIVAKLLGIELVELKEASCTGAGVISERNPATAYALNARNLALAEKTGLPLITQCSTCQGVLSRVNHDFKTTPALLDEANRTISADGHRYSGKQVVKHLLWMLVEDYGLENIKKKVVRPLTGLRIAPFYGCYLLRPSEALGHDDPANPKSMESLICALGAEPVDYEGKTKCCGFPISMMNSDASFRMAGKHLLDAKRSGADVLATPCPLCHLNLDSRQPDIEHHIGERIGLPVLHLSQLVALALGADPKDLKIKTHIVDAYPALAKLGIR